MSFFDSITESLNIGKNTFFRAVLFDDANYAHITARAAGLRRVGVYDEYRDDDLSGFVDLNFKDFSEVLEHYKEKGCF